MAGIKKQIDNLLITEWDECVVLGKPLNGKLLPWKAFFKETQQENRLLVLHTFSKLNSSDICIAQNLIDTRILYKLRFNDIKADMKAKNCLNIEQYLDFTDYLVQNIESDYQALFQLKLK